MLRINVNEEKQLTFEVQIGGVQQDQLVSHLRITIGEVEYGFPAKVGNDSITVNLPPLSKVVGGKINEGDEAYIKLELIADGHYLAPWQDKATLSNPLIVEATIKDIDFLPNSPLKTRLIVKEDGKTQQTVIEKKEEKQLTDEQLTDNIVKKLSEKFSHMLQEKDDSKEEPPGPIGDEGEEQVEEKCAVKEEEEIEDEETVEGPLDEQSKTATLEKLLADTIQKLGISEGGHSKKSKKEVSLQEFKQTLNEDMIMKYIEKAGTRNKKIQSIVYEQAVSEAGSGKPIDVLRQVIKIMKKT